MKLASPLACTCLFTFAATLCAVASADTFGNVVEWQETDFDLINGPDPDSSHRGVRGGYWGGASNITLGLGDLPPNHVDPVLGFRVASVVPEPNCLALLASTAIGIGLFRQPRKLRIRDRFAF